MNFDVMHVIWALIVSVGWIVLSWLLLQIPTVGAFLVQIIQYVWIFGLVFYGMKNVKGLTNGLVAGIIYGLVFAVVAVVFYYINWGGMPPYIQFDGGWGNFFGWPGMWGALIAVILFGGCIGWVNESK